MKLFITVIALITITFLSSCAAVRTVGKIYASAGDILVKSANEEEVKKAKLKNQGKNSDDDDEKEDDDDDSDNKEKNIITIKQNLTSVRVRSKPSAKKSVVTTLTGGDKVEKIGDKGDWLNIRFNIEGNQGEGWIKKDSIEVGHATSGEETSDTTSDEGTSNAGSTGEMTDIGNGQFDILAAGGFSGNRDDTYAKWDRTAKMACKGGKYKIISREWQSAEYPGLLGGIIECNTKKHQDSSKRKLSVFFYFVNHNN